MSDVVLSKEQLLQKFSEAYEETIATALDVERRGGTGRANRWGPNEIIAHLAGWEAMANVRIPAILAGMPPAEFGDETQTLVMNNAINAAFIMLAGDRPLASLCQVLRQAYQRSAELLSGVDVSLFHPGTYVYDRTSDAIEHCHEHMEGLELSLH